MRLYISKAPEATGGGANTFAWNFVRAAIKKGHTIASDIREADRAIIIAHWCDVETLRSARASGCYIVHRIDEYFEEQEDEFRRAKHARILELNRYADVTVFQSEFVRGNALPFLQPQRFAIIRNGADPRFFRGGRRPRRFIGHVTWSVHSRKRLDLLYQTIVANPQEKFWLVGRHAESGFDFRLPNVTLRGIRERRHIRRDYRMMKLLFFPSENEPCPNTPIEAILSGIPVCYNNSGGTPEVVGDCGEPLERLDVLLKDLDVYRQRCTSRDDLHFERVLDGYLGV